LDVNVETKTEDNVFVHVLVAVQYFVHPDKVYDAFYKLDHPAEQITAFVFDVVRGAVCGTPDSKHSDLTSYDWCVDGTGTVGPNTVGEQSCGATAPIHCGPHGKPYFIRVKRKPGATPTCSAYTLTVTATGGGTCDFTQACDTQIDEGP
jgi:hypothetical protein